MTVAIDIEKCTGCSGAREAQCERICPGGLLVREGVKVQLRDGGACWDCAACVKSCPHQALYLILPWPLGGRGARLYARASATETEWILRLPSGREERYVIPARINQKKPVTEI